ncbi:MAG: GAF domain-containing protein, partial [Rectinema sp.]|nr:GAF domain-containing protein [Rectinema sp.]
AATRENHKLIVDVVFTDISKIKQHERLLNALMYINEISNVEVRDFNDLDSAMKNIINTPRLLYLNCRSGGFVHFYKRPGVFSLDTIVNSSPLSPYVYSIDRLPAGFEQWLIGLLLSQHAEGTPLALPDIGIQIPSGFEDLQHLAIEPLLLQDRIIGVFFWCFGSDITRKDIERDAERRKQLSASISNAIRSMLLKHENEVKNRHLAILNRASLKLNSLFSQEEIAQSTLDILFEELKWAPSVIRFKTRFGEQLETVGYRSCSELSDEQKTHKLEAMNQQIRRPGQGLTGHVIQTGLPYRSCDLAHDPFYSETDKGMNYGIYAPIIIDGQSQGAIGVESDSYEFSEHDLRLLVSLAEIAAMALRSAQLIDVYKERVRWLEMLHAISERIEYDSDPVTLCQFLAKQAVETIGAESAEILIREPGTNTLRRRASVGWLDGTESTISVNDGNTSITSLVFNTGKSYVSPNLENDTNVYELTKKHLPENQGAVIVPIKDRADVIGVFSFAFRIPFRTSEEFLGLLEMFGSYAGIAISRANLVKELQESNQQLRDAYDATLSGWARAIGLRDDETLGHSARVVQIALAIGKAMRLEPDQLEDLKRGALLHDIGKLGIPDQILRKPG